MKTDVYLKLQKKFGGLWVATSKTGQRVFAKASNINKLFDSLKKLGLPPQKTVIGFVEKYGQLSAYISVSLQRN